MGTSSGYPGILRLARTDCPFRCRRDSECVPRWSHGFDFEAGSWGRSCVWLAHRKVPSGVLLAGVAPHGNEVAGPIPWKTCEPQVGDHSSATSLRMAT